MATKKVSKKELRRQQIAREKRRKLLLIGLPILAIVLLFAGIGIYRFTRPDIVGTINFGPLSNNHGQTTIPQVAGTDPNLPPVGGDHSGTLIPCQVYSAPVDPIQALHSLEHGAVWLAYRPDLLPLEVAELQTIAQNQGKILMSPYPGLESDVVMTAWSRQLVIDELPDDRVEEFISRYRNLGPEGGAGC